MRSALLYPNSFKISGMPIEMVETIHGKAALSKLLNHSSIKNSSLESIKVGDTFFVDYLRQEDLTIELEGAILIIGSPFPIIGPAQISGLSKDGKREDLGKERNYLTRNICFINRSEIHIFRKKDGISKWITKPSVIYGSSPESILDRFNDLGFIDEDL